MYVLEPPCTVLRLHGPPHAIILMHGVESSCTLCDHLRTILLPSPSLLSLPVLYNQVGQYFEFAPPAATGTPLSPSRPAPIGFGDTTKPAASAYDQDTPDSLMTDAYFLQSAADREKYQKLPPHAIWLTQADNEGWFFGHKGDESCAHLLLVLLMQSIPHFWLLTSS